MGLISSNLNIITISQNLILDEKNQEAIQEEIPQYLFEFTNGKYKDLPLFSKKKISFIDRIINQIVQIILDIFFINPILNLVDFRKKTSFKKYDLSPLAQDLLREKKNQIQEIAKKLGISSPEKFQLHLGDIYGSCPARVTTNNEIIIDPKFLIKPADLPDDLKLEKLDKKEISKEGWVVNFHKWLKVNFNSPDEKNFESKCEADHEMAWAKTWLTILRNQDNEKMFEFIMGHELGHRHFKHEEKRILVDFVISILSILTLGIASICKERIYQHLNIKFEKQADRFSAKKFNADGVINSLSYSLKTGRFLRKKYPKMYDAHGDYRGNLTHPSHIARIKYLKKMNVQPK